MKHLIQLKYIYVLTLLFISWMPTTQSMADDIKINETNFPDENFRYFLKKQSYGEDGRLTQQEIEQVTKISISNRNIKDLTGIKLFTSLTNLECGGNLLTSLDLSNCTALSRLKCGSNKLTSLDLSNCTALSSLECGSNQLTSLDLSNCTALEWLYCTSNQLTSLDLSNCTALSSFECASNQLTSLDLSSCTVLKKIRCTSNQISEDGMARLVASLPLCNNGELYVKYKDDGNVCTPGHVYVANEKGWKVYQYIRDYISDEWKEMQGIEDEPPSSTDIAVDATNFPDEVFRNYLLSQIYCWDGRLTQKRIANINSISISSFSEKKVKSLQGIGFFTALEFLYCSGNQLTSLDLSNCSSLSSLYCRNNQLTSLDLSNCTALSDLDCQNNQLTSLDLSNCTALSYLSCKNNQLTSLDLSNCTALSDLDCQNNQLTSLDLSNCTALSYLDCQNNQLTSLDLSNCSSLSSLYCNNNQLTEEAMDLLLSTLPVRNGGKIYLIYPNDGNVVCTPAQVDVALTKGWTVYKYVESKSNWVEMSGTMNYSLNTSNHTASVIALKDGKYSGDIIIPETVIRGVETYTVTSIGSGAFSDCLSLKSIKLPTSLKTIDYMAFYGCKNLHGIDIPEGVETIGDRAFETCYSLDHVTLPTTLKSSGGDAFEVCSGLRAVYIYDLNKYCDINFGYSGNPLHYAHHLYLNGEEVTKVVLPQNSTAVKNCIFDGASAITSIIIPENVTAIGPYAFFGCSSLTDVVIPNQVTSIGRWAFEKSGLKKVTLGASVKNIEESAFCKCDQLAEVTSMIVEPFTLQSNVFKETNIGDITLYVPTGTKVKYANTFCWNQFKEITEMDTLLPESGRTIDFGNTPGLEDGVILDGAVIGNIYFNISSNAGSYNSAEGCISVTKPTSDSVVNGSSIDIFGESFRDNYNGIIFKVGAGSGSVKITAETTGNMTLKVRIGNNAPFEMVIQGKITATFPYNVSEPTYVYIYAGKSASVKAQYGAVAGTADELKIYGIECNANTVGIDSMNNRVSDTATIYNLNGQRLTKPQRGVNIIDGKKVVVR